MPALGLDADYLAVDAARLSAAGGGDNLTRLVSELEFRHNQRNMLLRDSDKNGMSAGLEIRVPFLGERLLDTVLVPPGRVRLPGVSEGKSLLRRAFADLLGPVVLGQRTKEFVARVDLWTSVPMRSLCEAALGALQEGDVLARAEGDAVWHVFLEEPRVPDVDSRPGVSRARGVYTTQRVDMKDLAATPRTPVPALGRRSRRKPVSPHRGLGGDVLSPHSGPEESGAAVSIVSGLRGG